MSSPAIVTNHSSGTIAGGSIAVAINDTSQAAVTNAGGYIAGGNYGVSVSGAGTVTNLSGGSIIGAGSSGTNAAAVFIYGYGPSGNQPNVQIYNAGSLTGATGVAEFLGGSVTNASGGTIDGRSNFGVFLDGNGTLVNDGAISGAKFGADLYEGGLVQNLAGGTISGGTGIYFGLFGGTVTNAGTVIGTSGDAVDFSAYGGHNYRLIVDPGAVFVGAVNGGGGVLELATGSSAGSLSGIGTSITNFASSAIRRRFAMERIRQCRRPDSHECDHRPHRRRHHRPHRLRRHQRRLRERRADADQQRERDDDAELPGPAQHR